MNVQRLFPLSLSLITAAVLSACATQNTPTASKSETVVQPKSTSIPSRRADSESKVLSDYSQYQSAIDATKRGDDAWVQQFLSQASDSAMAENVRNEWLKTLGARGQWDLFRQEFSKLNAAGVAQEVQCYADLSSGNYSNAAELVREAVRLRAFMAHPRGGTWTWAALSMKSSEGYKLISDFDYDREPVLDPPYTAEDCAKELEVFPRDPGAIPDWMKIGV